MILAALLFFLRLLFCDPFFRLLIPLFLPLSLLLAAVLHRMGRDLLPPFLTYIPSLEAFNGTPPSSFFLTISSLPTYCFHLSSQDNLTSSFPACLPLLLVISLVVFSTAFCYGFLDPFILLSLNRARCWVALPFFL